MTNDSSPPNPKHEPALVEARDYALAVIKLATGRPTPGALLLAYDYRATLRRLHEDILGPLGAEDARLVGVSVALLRAAYDAEKKGQLDPSYRNNYYARLDDAARTSTWATSYMARLNGRPRGGMVLVNGDLAERRAPPIGEHMTQEVIQQVTERATDDVFTMPPSAPRAPKDRRKPTSIYERAGGRTQFIATKVNVRF